MKKRGDKKKKNLSKKGKKRFFSKNNLLTFGVITTFLLCIILLGFTNLGHTGKAVDTPLPTAEGITGSIHDLFTQWQNGGLDINIAKYIIFFMLAGVIWGALNFAQIPDNAGFQALIAFPAAFLATAYLTPGEVLAALQSWDALGLTLTFVLPFMIAVLISSMFFSSGKSRRMTVGKILVGLLLWLTLAGVQIYKFVEGLILGKIPWALNMTLMISFGITLLTCLVLAFQFRFRMWMWRLGLEVRALSGQLTSTQLEQAKNAMEQVEQLRNAAKEAKATRKNR
jgi:hypothetical protein